MPHLSPIIWLFLFVMVWVSFVFSVVFIEFVEFSLNR